MFLWLANSGELAMFCDVFCFNILDKNVLPFRTHRPSSVYELISGFPSSKFPWNISLPCKHFHWRAVMIFSSTWESRSSPRETDVTALWTLAVYFGTHWRDSTKVWEIFKIQKPCRTDNFLTLKRQCAQCQQWMQYPTGWKRIVCYKLEPIFYCLRQASNLHCVEHRHLVHGFSYSERKNTLC